MKKILLGTLLFKIVSFAIQYISHFIVNVNHYAKVTFIKKEIVFELGFLTMILQGMVLSYFFNLYAKNEYSIRKGLTFGLLMTYLLVSYTAFAEPAKYNVPSVMAWILTEGIVGIIQFSVYVIGLSLVYKKLK